MYTILVVDDDVGLARTLARKLDSDGRRVLTAESSNAALRHFSEGPVDIILSDDHMPGQSGRDLLASLRQSHPDTIRILMTGQPTLESALAAFNQQEVYRYLTKPFEVDSLKKVIDEALERVKSQRAQKKDGDGAERRRRLMEELDKEHPGLLAFTPGEYVPQAAGETLELVISALVDEETPPDVEVTTNPVELGDELLRVAMRHPRWALVIEPNAAGHQIVVDAGVRVMHLATVDSSLGDAIAARLAVIAGLDLAKIGHQLGRLSLSTEEGRGEALVALRTSAIGLSVELRRLVTGAEETATVDAGPTGADAGAYKLLEVIGRGGLGIVYRALHTALERVVAVKVLRESAGRDPLASARLLREARAASRARHPGIVSVLDYGRLPDQRPFIVMELVESPTLDDLLQKSGALAVEDAMHIGRGLAVALAAAHDAGVLHRDLKPSNIFVDEDLSVKISDFGAAKLLNDAGPQLTAEGTTIGTPHYMAPEQARNERVDRRADIYSLGCVIYEMLSGQPPYEGDSSLHVVSQHILSPIPTVLSPHGPLPLPVARAVKRAMAKNPAERHQTAPELLADLEQAGSALQRKGWRRWLP